MVTPGPSLTTNKTTAPAEPGITPAAGVAEQKHLRHFVLFLLGADLVALFIYLLLVPTNALDAIAERLQSFWPLVKSVGSVAGSVVTYFGLKTALRQYLLSINTVFDQTYFAALVGLITLIVWAAVLPIWRVELQVDPPQLMPPRVELMGKTRALIEPRDKETAEKTYTLEGLLLRPYEITIAGAREPLVLPLITVLKGSVFHRPLVVRLPCTLEVSPRMPGAEVWGQRMDEKDGHKIGTLPGNGRMQLLPGFYDVLRFEYQHRVGSMPVLVSCPLTHINVQLTESEKSMATP